MALAFATAVVGLCAQTASSQPPEGKGGAGGKKGGPPGFELGRVLPPFVREELDLTAEPEKEIAALKREVRDKPDNILTADQKKKAADGRPPFRPPTGKDGPPRGRWPGRPPSRSGAPGGGEDPRPAKTVYTREEFKRLVEGKTTDEVIAAVGRPDSTADRRDGRRGRGTTGTGSRTRRPTSPTRRSLSLTPKGGPRPPGDPHRARAARIVPASQGPGTPGRLPGRSEELARPGEGPVLARRPLLAGGAGGRVVPSGPGRD